MVPSISDLLIAIRIGVNLIDQIRFGQGAVDIDKIDFFTACVLCLHDCTNSRIVCLYIDIRRNRSS